MINKFGITLEKLTLESALLVREWRNSSRVNRFMDFQEEISIEQQINWFEKINASENHFFMIKKNDKEIGLVHLDRFDNFKKTAFAGLFIGEEKYEGTGVAFAASIALLDFAFDQLNLNEVNAKVHHKNHVALNYNKSLGFIEDGKESEKFVRLKIEESTFKNKRLNLVSLLTL